MLDLFSPMSPEAQRANRVAYRGYLIERDGELDIAKRTLSRREANMARFDKPLSRIREIDRVRFEAQSARFSPDRSLSSEELLLLALVRLNSAEAYGVERTVDYARHRAATGPDEIELLVHVEESYHTRILLSSAVLYGMRIDTPFKPSQGLRAMILGIAKAPEVVARPLILAGEIVGTLIFLEILHAARDILRHDAELRDAVEERISDVLVDEIGHISFNRMLLGHAGLQRAKLVLPIVAEVVAQTLPALGALGLRPSARGGSCVTSSDRLPDFVRRSAFVV